MILYLAEITDSLSYSSARQEPPNTIAGRNTRRSSTARRVPLSFSFPSFHPLVRAISRNWNANHRDSGYDPVIRLVSRRLFRMLTLLRETTATTIGASKPSQLLISLNRVLAFPSVQGDNLDTRVHGKSRSRRSRNRPSFSANFVKHLCDSIDSMAEEGFFRPFREIGLSFSINPRRIPETCRGYERTGRGVWI